MAMVVMLEHGLEQVGYVTASAIWRVQVTARLDRFVFCGHGGALAGVRLQ